jgi:hypothetical protein
MIDSVSNDFHSDDRCPMCGWSFISTLHKHTVCVPSLPSAANRL